jgi:hypothetical protein
MGTPHLTELTARALLTERERSAVEAAGDFRGGASPARSPSRVMSIRVGLGDWLIRLGVLVAGYRAAAPQPPGVTASIPS